MIEKIKNLEPKQKNILEIVLIITLVIIVFIGSLIGKAISLKKEQIESMKTTLVTDNSRYFTVISCAKRFINTVSSKNKNDIILSLDNEYIEMNRITNDNVLSFVPNMFDESMYDYVGIEMYQKVLSKNVTRFYVKGRIAKSVLNEINTYSDYDMTITLNESNFTFTVIPGIGGLDYEK